MSEIDEVVITDEGDIEIDEELRNEWSIMGVWNEELLLGREERISVRRNYIWASEIGRDPYERWLKMYNIPSETEFSNRLLRVFEAGNFFERMIGLTFQMAGLVIEDNVKHRIPEDDFHLAVSVKPDFLVGGNPDWEQVKADLDTNPMYQFMFDQLPSLKTISLKLLETFKERYPNGLENLLYEIKTVNSQLFWAKKNYLSDAYEHHKMQTYSGMKATNTQKGRRLYISKDDMTLAEFPLSLDDPFLEEAWETDVRAMTNYIRTSDEYFERKGMNDQNIIDAVLAGEVPPDIMPPKPSDIIFDKRKKQGFQLNKQRYSFPGSYVDNWEIGWSNYFSLITGMESVDEWKLKNKEQLKVKNDELKEQYKIKNNIVKIKK